MSGGITYPLYRGSTASFLLQIRNRIVRSKIFLVSQSTGCATLPRGCRASNFLGHGVWQLLLLNGDDRDGGFFRKRILMGRTDRNTKPEEVELTKPAGDNEWGAPLSARNVATAYRNTAPMTDRNQCAVWRRPLASTFFKMSRISTGFISAIGRERMGAARGNHVFLLMVCSAAPFSCRFASVRRQQRQTCWRL